MMLTLFSGSGSASFRLVTPIQNSRAEALKRGALRSLRASGETAAATVLSDNPFELWEGENGFGDTFQVLYLKAPLERYKGFENDVDTDQLSQYGEIAAAYKSGDIYVRFVAVDIDLDASEIAVVEQPDLMVTSAVVERALTDAETLIRQHGALSGLDRVHTAFHGYLKAICIRSNIDFADDSSITDFYKLVKNNQNLFKRPTTRNQDVERIFGAMSSVIDSLNTIRNRASVAHPNDTLLDDPEAMLSMNAVRTLLHYLDACLSR